MDKPMMEQQMELFRRGGLNDEGGEIDEVSGNKVPVGGTKKGVRDDVPAMVSEGEFVFPEDVVRYIGLDKLMQLRQQAKMGLKKMEAMGQMGNGDEATIPDDLPFDMADLIIVAGDTGEELEMQEGGFVVRPTTVTRTVPTSSTYNQPVEEEMPMFTSVRNLLPPAEESEPINVDFENLIGNRDTNFKEYRNKEGQSIIVPFIGDTPMFDIPEGYTLYEPTEEEEEDTAEEMTNIIQSTDVEGRGDVDTINAFVAAGGWQKAPLEMYIQNARAVTSTEATAVVAITSALGLGLPAIGRELDKAQIMATIDARIAEARTTSVPGQVAALEAIKADLENNQSLFSKVVKTINKTFMPKEQKKTAVAIAAKNIVENVPLKTAVEVSLRPAARPTTVSTTQPQQYESTAAQMQAMQFDPFSTIGSIEEVAARDVPFSVNQTPRGNSVSGQKPGFGEIVGYSEGYEIYSVPSPQGDKQRNQYQVFDRNGTLLHSEYTTRRSIDPIESLNSLKSTLSEAVEEGRIPRGGITLTGEKMSRPSAVATTNVQQPTFTSQLPDELTTPAFTQPTFTSQLPDELTTPAFTSQLPSVQQPKDSPRLGYESGQDTLQSVPSYISSPISQPSISQIDFTNIQTSGPPSVPDAVRTPLGTAAAASAREQRASLTDPAVALAEQARDMIGTSGQSVEDTIARANEAIDRSKTPTPTAVSVAAPAISSVAQAEQSLGAPLSGIDVFDISQTPTPTDTTAPAISSVAQAEQSLGAPLSGIDVFDISQTPPKTSPIGMSRPRAVAKSATPKSAQISSARSPVSKGKEISDAEIADRSRHFSIALGQGPAQAARSGANAVAADKEAQAQTGRANARAVTDGNGNAVRDGNGDVVTSGDAVAQKGSDTGGAEGGSSTVVCTMLHNYGYLSDDIWKLDQQFGKQIQLKDPEALEGYHMWAKPLVNWMEKESILSKLFFKHCCVPLTQHWANHMAHTMEPENYKQDYLGKLLLKIGIPVSKFIYRLKSRKLQTV